MASLSIKYKSFNETSLSLFEKEINILQQQQQQQQYIFDGLLIGRQNVHQNTNFFKNISSNSLPEWENPGLLDARLAMLLYVQGLYCCVIQNEK